jgi:alanine-synthesizing transaminase
MFASRTCWSLTPNRLSELIGERRRLGAPLLDLTESNPTRCGFVYDAEVILAALADRQALSYQPDPRGLASARRAVAGYYAERGVELDQQQIFLTTSTSEAYTYVFRLLANPGDTVLVPQPSYPLFDFLADLNDVEIVPYPLTYHQGWQIDLQTLESRLGARCRAVVLVHPNNPTGSYLRQSELEFLLHACPSRNLALITDEVFADYSLTPDPQRVATCAGVTEVLSFTLSGLSKISALPQMKLAWLVVNGPSRPLNEALARLEVIADTYLSLSAPLAHALPALLETGRALQPQILERVRSNLQWLDTQLISGLPISRLQVEGGWYVVLKVPCTRTDEVWAIELVKEEGVITYPGHFFDFPRDGYLVVSLLPSAEIFQPAMVRILARLAQSPPL